MQNPNYTRDAQLSANIDYIQTNWGISVCDHEILTGYLDIFSQETSPGSYQFRKEFVVCYHFRFFLARRLEDDKSG